MADDVYQDLLKVYGRGTNSRDYAWSGLGSFRGIEGAVFQGEGWNPRREGTCLKSLASLRNGKMRRTNVHHLCEVKFWERM